jgi:hypothetical protein
MALIAALIAAASLAANPARLVLGRDAGADLELRAPAGAKVTLSSSVGTVSELELSGGVFHARFNPPPLKSPTVALVLAQIDEGGERSLAWTSIPMSGSDTMEIETRPGSKVEAEVAGKVIGPVIADKSGTARLPMVVPPGVSKAMLRITDRLGNNTEKPLDLEPPPYSRLRVAARGASASASSPLELEIFVVKPDGAPDDRAQVELNADEGEAEVIERTGHGVYLARYQPPEGKSGTAHLEAKANGQLAGAEVPYTSGRLRIARPFWQSALGVQRPWSVSVGLLGGGGATFDGAIAGSALLETALRLEILPVELLAELGGSLFSEVDQRGVPASSVDRTRARSVLLQAGVRLGRQLVRGMDGHATFLIGVQRQSVSTTLAAGGVRDQASWPIRYGLALGANARLGPGRALAQIQFDGGPVGVAGLAGSLGGVQLFAGYLFTLR